jgi:hypothetical protein
MDNPPTIEEAVARHEIIWRAVSNLPPRLRQINDAHPNHVLMDYHSSDPNFFLSRNTEPLLREEQS